MQDNKLSYLRILVVDDEDFALNLSVRMLEQLGCTNVATAKNGALAIEQLGADGEPFDIVISDLNMPDMDGFEFIRQVADWNASGGLILVSGEKKQVLKEAHKLAKKKKLNILGALSKPLDADELKGLLRKFKMT